MRLLHIDEKCSCGDDKFLPPPRMLCDSRRLYWIFSKIERFLIINIFIIMHMIKGQGALIIE